jgi:hypothetical protein
MCTIVLSQNTLYSTKLLAIPQIKTVARFIDLTVGFLWTRVGTLRAQNAI